MGTTLSFVASCNRLCIETARSFCKTFGRIGFSSSFVVFRHFILLASEMALSKDVCKPSRSLETISSPDAFQPIKALYLSQGELPESR